MKILGAIVAFLFICAVSALLFLDSIPAVVHRTAPEPGRTYFILAGLLALGSAWWLISWRSRALTLLGWLVLAVPFSAHALWQTSILLADQKGANLPAQMQIENFRETAIFWHGFDGPVGIAVEFDLIHPSGLEGLVFTPQVRMAPAYDIARDDLQSTRTFSGGYFQDWHIDAAVGDLTLLKPVLFQRLYADSPPDHDFDLLDPSGRTHLVYRLYPGTVDRLDSKDRICLVNPSFGLPACAANEEPSSGCVGKYTRKVTDITYAIGTNLNALWTADGRTFRNADISPLITQALRQHSSLQGNRAAWTALQKQFEPAQLAAAGFGKCPPGEDSHSIGRVCFCRL